MKQVALQARDASIQVAAFSTAVKNRALDAIAEELLASEQQIVAANQEDLRRAEQDSLNPALLKRLKFDAAKLKEAVAGVREVAALEDPVGKTLGALELDDGLELYRVSCPIGVLGIVFESRPDALVQISALALKSGNALLLKGGAEAASTNRVLADIILSASQQADYPEGWLALLESRDDVAAMLALDEYIDLVIPRGSNEFVRFVMDNTRIPVLGHADGICHVFVDRDADLKMAVDICVDSKCQYPAVCNAMETMLVDASIADDFLPAVCAELRKHDVELRGCEEVRARVAVAASTAEDDRTEYNDLILSIRVVKDVSAAIDFINHHGSHHTDTIVTENSTTAQRFQSRVDSASVFWNCSTRFADGFRYGLGAEVGVSTNKVHARGPVGLEGLVTYQWRGIGKGHVVGDYSGAGGKSFSHRAIDKPFPK